MPEYALKMLFYHNAVDDLLCHPDHKPSIVDCVSFTLMRHHGLETVFGFDKHFFELGFKILGEP